jgi:MOSC domain-containing protein YiiM
MRRYHQDHSPGWSRVYARVLREGMVRAGDAARLG